MNQRIVIQLGRIGDILNILPLLYDDANKGNRSGLMVAKEFSELLDGVSYCDRYVFDGHMSQLDLAVRQAETLSGDVKVCQLVGPLETIKKAIIMRNGVEYRATTESFQKDQWNLAGRLEDWKRQIPLVFDRRDPEREAKLIKQVFPNKRKTILVATGGTSSPFPYSELLYELLRLKFRTYYNIVNISDIKAERFYDLLGVFEDPRATCSCQLTPLLCIWLMPPRIFLLLHWLMTDQVCGMAQFGGPTTLRTCATMILPKGPVKSLPPSTQFVNLEAPSSPN